MAIYYHIARSCAPLAGNLINPAFTLALAVQYATEGKWNSLAYCWAWIIGDVLGGLAAVYYYQNIQEPVILQLREIKRKS